MKKTILTKKNINKFATLQTSRFAQQTSKFGKRTSKFGKRTSKLATLQAKNSMKWISKSAMHANKHTTKPGFSFLEVTVSLLLFGIIFTAVMQAIYTTGKIKESDARHSGNLRLLENIAVGLRTGLELYDYGFREREQERLRHFFEIENPGQEFYFNGNTSRLKLKRESSFRRIKKFMTDTQPKKEVSIFRQVIHPDPFLFRFRLEVKDPGDETTSSLDMSVSYYLSRFYN